MEDNRGFSRREEEWEIDMGDLVRMLLHRLWLILLAMIGGAAAAFIISRFLITPPVPVHHKDLYSEQRELQYGYRF